MVTATRADAATNPFVARLKPVFLLKTTAKVYPQVIAGASTDK
jgi:hypothetical protein